MRVLYLDALRESMADRQFVHVVLLLSETDEVVVYPRLVLPRVVEVEIFRLHVVLGQLLGLEFRYVFQKALFLRHGHAPDDDSTILE